MRKLKNAWIVPAVWLLLGCSMSAKPGAGGEEAAPVAAQVTATEGEVIPLTEAEFLDKVFDYKKNPDKWVYKGAKPCIVDFYADWCGPCKQVAPILKELAGTYKGQLVIYKVDVDKQKGLAAAFGIQSIPSILFIPREGQPQLAQGAMPREEFVKAIEAVLLGKP